ncbi:MAG: methyltransferase domain-containing protein [Rhodobacteraceae bacterium]|nr:methyltransferase domain-containing protein [Paracoccaceae bacterium]
MSNQPFQHGMTPHLTHDEIAREHAVRAMRFHLYGQVSKGTRAYFGNVVAPEFEKAQKRKLEDRAEVRKVMEGKTYTKFHLSLQRSVQEVMWNTVVENVERQLPELNQRAKDCERNLGSLKLDPTFEIPRYVANIDIHCMPGGYGNEGDLADSVAAGAIYDRGISMYQQAAEGELGLSVIRYLQQNFPTFKPAKILDMGCTVGMSTVRYAETFPDAEIHAIDVAAPCLRYGHARAESKGQAVHFSQQNAECTNFADNTFDLVVSTILAHETSTHAWHNIIKESYRVLKPGGVMVHADLPQFVDVDVYTQFLFGNETKFNNEPFWSTFRTIDLKKAMLDAGFADDKCFLDLAERHDPGGFRNTKVSTAARTHGGKTPPAFGWGVQVGLK